MREGEVKKDRVAIEGAANLVMADRTDIDATRESIL